MCYYKYACGFSLGYILTSIRNLVLGVITRQDSHSFCFPFILMKKHKLTNYNRPEIEVKCAINYRQHGDRPHKFRKNNINTCYFLYIYILFLLNIFALKYINLKNKALVCKNTYTLFCLKTSH